jgi:outer membrane protein
MRPVFLNAAVLTLSIASAALAAPAVAAEPMTLPQAVTYALNHSQTVAQQYANVTAAEHTLAIQRATAYPTVDGQLQSILGKSMNYGGSYAAVGLVQQNVFSQNTAQIGTNYTLTTGGLAFLQLASDRAAAAHAEQTLASTEDQIAATVTNAYYNVVQKKAIVTVDNSDLHYQNVLVTDAKVKEHAGVAAGVDVLKAQVNQAKSASTLVGARADVDNATESLAQTINAPLDQQFVFPSQILQPNLPNGSVDTLEEIAMNSRPDVKAANDAVASAKYTRQGWNRELFPTVQIGASFGSQVSPTLFVQEQEEFDAEYQSCLASPIPGVTCIHQFVPVPRGVPGFWNIGVTSTFTLPLIDYGERHSERVNDDAQLTYTERELDQTRTQVDLDVRQSYRAAQTALAQLDYAREEARLGTESARIAQLQYTHGLISLADVIQTQQQSVTAQSDFVNARVSYVEAVVKLRVSLGTYTAQSAVADL